MLSPTMRVPPIKSGNYRAAAVLTLSEAMLRKPISFYLVGKVDRGAYRVAGVAEEVQRDLSSLLVEKTKKKLFLGVRNTSGSKFGSCQFEIIGAPAESEELGQSRAERGEETAS